MTVIMISYIAIFIFGGMVGATLAILVVGLCQSAAAADKRLGHIERWTKEELDAKIAELMELKKVGYYRRKNQFIVGWELCDKGDPDPFGNKARLYYYPDPGFLTTVPEYSTDIAAAWLVVEKMIADGWEFDVDYTNVNEIEGEPLEYQWWCSFIYYTDDENDHKCESAQAETAPLAICRAALMAAEAE